MNIIAVVVTYNKRKMLNECINALLKQTIIPNKIIVFDNASDDGTKEYLSSIKSNVIIPFFSNKNLGGAGGFNQAIKEAMKHEPTAVWVMDDDSIVEKDSLEKLLEAKEQVNNDFGFLASNVLWTDRTPCLMNIPNVDEQWSSLAVKGLVKVKTASFVSMFINAEVIKEAGYPISDFFIWGDDVEYSDRISNIKPSYFVSDSIVIHKMKENVKVNILTDDRSRISRYYYDRRNKFYRFKKKGKKSLLKYILNTIALCIKIIFSASEDKLLKLSTVLKGFFSGIFFNPKVEKYIKPNNI